MVLFNYSTKELTAKIVYYGPGLCGKTTNLQYIHKNLSENVKGKMLSLATKTDRTLFFDFLPMDLGEIRGMRTRMQLYTVPGQVFYNETRKLVLKGADGIVFVADSQKEMLGPNIESFKNLEENLKAHGLKLAEMPHVIQFNKRDLPKLSSIEELNASLNKHNAPFYESVATTGIGVQDSLKAITKLVLLHLTKKYEPRPAAPGEAAAAPAPAPARAAAPPAAPPQAAARPSRAPAPAKAGKGRKPEPDRDDVDSLVDEMGDAADSLPLAQPAAAAPIAAIEPIAFDASQLGAPAAGDERIEVAVDSAPLGEAPVRLTEVLTDHDLFSDPGFEVARLMNGDAREIVIPVLVGPEGAARRYKLSLRLRLDSVD